VAELAEALPVVNVDRVRLPRAIGTFIGHSLRTATRPVLRVLATLGDAEHYVRIGIEVAAQHTVGRDLRAMLDPSRARGSEQHRGLALALGVARSIVELHGGRVAVRQDVGQGTYVVIELPVGGVLAQVPDGR
jgi:K+-sensing histidine kinase KdpD